MPAKKSREDFIRDATKLHGNLFNYDEVIYVNNKTPVWITCNLRKHRFLQRPDLHLHGNGGLGAGCSKCSGMYKKNNDEIINQFRDIHGEKYEYPDFEYKNNKQKIKIYCKEHKFSFELNYRSHIGGIGCKKCKIKKYIKIFNKIHSYRYDYSLSEYNGYDKPITIICPIHGNFEQNPFYHIDGCGCPKCGNIISSGEQRIIQYLENNSIEYIHQHRFPNCKYKNTLPFDFYIPKYNIVIEFDGEHHYMSVNFFGGEKEFLKQKEKDKIKDMYCIENEITCIRILKKDCENFGYSFIENKLNGVFYGI